MQEWSNKTASIAKNGTSLSLSNAAADKIIGSSSRLANLNNSFSTKVQLSTELASKAVALSPVVAGSVVGVVSVGLYGISNFMRYVHKRKTAKEAFKDTVKSSAGMGVAAGLGLATVNVMTGTALAFGQYSVCSLSGQELR